MLGIYKAIAQRASSSKILLLVLGIQTALIIVRTLNLYYTGFQTADEVNYILDVMIGHPYGTRTFFNDQLIFFFQLFGINSITRFIAFFPFYLVFWTFPFIILSYKTVGLLTRNRITRDFVILSLPFAISYSLLSVGLLTEGPALTMCMLGIYAWIRYSKVEKKWYLVAISGAAFLAAAYSREPYDIFPVAASVIWIGLALLRNVPWHHAATFVLISLVVAAPTSPYYGAAGAEGSVSTFSQTMTSTITLPLIVTVPVVQTITITHGGNGTPVTTTTTTTTRYVTMTTTSTSVATQVTHPGWGSILSNSWLLFFYGMFLGWGPTLFILSLVSFVILLVGKKGEKRPWLLILFAVLSLGTFYGSTYFLSNEVSFLLHQGLSNLIRLTNTTIPAYILLSAFLVDRLSERKVKILAALLIILTVGGAGFYVTAVQTNLQLPYNVIDFGHVTMQLQARNYLIKNSSYDNPTIVFLPSHWEGAQLYLRDIPGLLMYPTEEVPTATYRSNYTESHFLMLHPTLFYVLAESSLADWNSTSSLPANVNQYFGYESLFLIKTYGFLYHIDTSSYPATPYAIVSVNAFDSPTGHFLAVHVKWDGS